MLNISDYRKEAAKVVDWIEAYMANLRSLPVKSRVNPRTIYDALGTSIPIEGEEWDQILEDVTTKILPGMTHWQHPNFHAFFPANGSVESQLAEMMTTAFGAQCMIWETSPAAAELEQRCMEWIARAIGIPGHWEGVIQDSASSATLVAMVCARERATGLRSMDEGCPSSLRVYCSTQTHSSVEKAVGLAGIGRNNLVKVGINPDQSLDVERLKEAIEEDKKRGLRPCAVVVTIGTTGTLAVDNLEQIAKICVAEDIWCHVDAAYAGNALFLPTYQSWINGIEQADSFVFNPHKWLFTHFDCSAYFVRDAGFLIRCMEVLPEYLRTRTRGLVNDYRDWGVPLGRRFRALKLWMVLRSYGLEGIQTVLTQHISWAGYVAERLRLLQGIDLFPSGRLNVVFFSCQSGQGEDQDNQHTERLYHALNDSGEIYLSHTKLDGRLILRLVFGQTYLEKRDVDKTVEVIGCHWEALNLIILRD